MRTNSKCSSRTKLATSLSEEEIIFKLVPFFNKLAISRVKLQLAELLRKSMEIFFRSDL